MTLAAWRSVQVSETYHGPRSPPLSGARETYHKLPRRVAHQVAQHAHPVASARKNPRSDRERRKSSAGQEQVLIWSGELLHNLAAGTVAAHTAALMAVRPAQSCCRRPRLAARSPEARLKLGAFRPRGPAGRRPPEAACRSPNARRPAIQWAAIRWAAIQSWDSARRPVTGRVPSRSVLPGRPARATAPGAKPPGHGARPTGALTNPAWLPVIRVRAARVAASAVRAAALPRMRLPQTALPQTAVRRAAVSQTAARQRALRQTADRRLRQTAVRQTAVRQTAVRQTAVSLPRALPTPGQADRDGLALGRRIRSLTPRVLPSFQSAGVRPGLSFRPRAFPPRAFRPRAFPPRAFPPRAFPPRAIPPRAIPAPRTPALARHFRPWQCRRPRCPHRPTQRDGHAATSAVAASTGAAARRTRAL